MLTLRCVFSTGAVEVKQMPVCSSFRSITCEMATPLKHIDVVRGQEFDVAPRYTNLAYIGEGAYGMVV